MLENFFKLMCDVINAKWEQYRIILLFEKNINKETRTAHKSIFVSLHKQRGYRKDPFLLYHGVTAV